MVIDMKNIVSVSIITHPRRRREQRKMTRKQMRRQITCKWRTYIQIQNERTKKLTEPNLTDWPAIRYCCCQVPLALYEGWKESNVPVSSSTESERVRESETVWERRVTTQGVRMDDRRKKEGDARDECGRRVVDREDWMRVPGDI